MNQDQRRALTFPVMGTKITASSIHPAVSYLTHLFSTPPDGVLCLTFINERQKHTDNKFVPLESIISDSGIARLTARNMQDHVYVSMQRFKEGSLRRIPLNVERISHVFLEVDENGDVALDSIRTAIANGEIPAPSVIVESSPHKYQFIWNVRGFTNEEAVATNKSLVMRFGGDPQCTDIVRVLRIPGFRNIKSKYSLPPVVKIIEMSDGVWTPADFKVPKFEEPAESILPAIGAEDFRLLVKHVVSVLRVAGIKHSTPAPWADAIKIKLETCPWADAHTAGPANDAILIVQPSGVLVFRCLHSHCIERRWKDFKTFVEHKMEKPVSFSIPKPISPAASDKRDMSESVLVGKLGEIYRKRLSHFPIAYAYPALLTAAGVLVPSPPHASGTQTNLLCVLVGPLGSGKSQAILQSFQTMGILDSKHYTNCRAGSAEGLFRMLEKQQSSGSLDQNVVVDLDEWGHLMAKADIQNSTFATSLTTAFYKRQISLVVAGGKSINLTAQLSMIGGAPDSEYDLIFSSTASAGLYDRFLHGMCPEGFQFHYRPFSGSSESLDLKSVEVDGSVWEVAKQWRIENARYGRAIELAVRAAIISASADGITNLNGKYFEQFKPFLMEQMRLRAMLAPNEGVTNEAKVSIAVMRWLHTHSSSGQWIAMRDLQRGINFTRNRLGPGILNHALKNMATEGTIELNWEMGKIVSLRTVNDD